MGVSARVKPNQLIYYGVGGDAKPRDAGVYTHSLKAETIGVKDHININNWVETGWWRPVDNPGWNNEPKFFACSQYNAPESCVKDLAYPSKEQYHTSRVYNVNIGGVIWIFELDRGTVRFFRDVPFQFGQAVGQGERHNFCDQGYARWMALQTYTQHTQSWPPYYYRAWEAFPDVEHNPLDLQEDPDYKFCRIDHDDFKVRKKDVDCFVP
jgi:hypothetical protein